MLAINQPVNFLKITSKSVKISNTLTALYGDTARGDFLGRTGAQGLTLALVLVGTIFNTVCISDVQSGWERNESPSEKTNPHSHRVLSLSGATQVCCSLNPPTSAAFSGLREPNDR